MDDWSLLEMLLIRQENLEDANDVRLTDDAQMVPNAALDANQAMQSSVVLIKKLQEAIGMKVVVAGQVTA